MENGSLYYFGWLGVKVGSFKDVFVLGRDRKDEDEGEMNVKSFVIENESEWCNVLVGMKRINVKREEDEVVVMDDEVVVMDVEVVFNKSSEREEGELELEDEMLLENGDKCD